MKDRRGIRKAAFSVILLVLLWLPEGPAKGHTEVAENAPVERFKLSYWLGMSAPNSHLFEIRIRIDNIKTNTVDVAMPAWSPGRYVIYNFTRNVQEFAARSANGNLLTWDKLDKQSWRIDCRGQQTIEVSYKVFANDLSGTFSQLNDQHANINGAAVFMYVNGHKQDAIELKIEKPANWKLISGAVDHPEQTEFHFANYDLLIDTPVEIGDFEVDSFQHDGRSYRVVLHSYTSFNNKSQLLASLQRIVAAQTAICGLPDFTHYTFIFHLAPYAQNTDGMEHLNSTQIIENNLEELIATASHEFFHVWNVKRIRPVELGPWDYSREVHTKSLWISEGLTSYYGDLSLLRAGVWSRA
ncbi:MAG: hypothetical protein AB1489_20415, partial [Acidobacteriota bacterium]